MVSIKEKLIQKYRSFITSKKPGKSCVKSHCLSGLLGMGEGVFISRMHVGYQTAPLCGKIFQVFDSHFSLFFESVFCSSHYNDNIIMGGLDCP